MEPEAWPPDDDAGGAAPAGPERLLTARFGLVVASGLAYFLGLAMLAPVLPRYLAGPLGAGGLGVGVGVGIFALGAVLLRPWTGRIGDRFGRRVLIVGGALVVGTSTLAYGLVESLPYLVAVRFLTGVGEAAFFVGAATMITDLAPEHRRGEAVSYWSVAVYGGVAFGPVLGEWVLGDGRYGATWLVAGGLALLAATLGSFTRDVARPEPADPAARGGRLLHPAALRPGVVLFLGLFPLAAFLAFLPLYVDRIDGVEAGPILFLYGALILGVRIVGARVPDRLGPFRAGTLALAGVGTGMGIVAAVPTVAGLVAGTVVFASGMSLLYPALLTLVVAGVPETQRASVIATFSAFFDLSQGVGAALAGGIVVFAGERGAFAAAAALAIVGIALLASIRRQPGRVDGAR